MSRWFCITILFLFSHYVSLSQQLSLGKTPHLLNKAAVLDLNADNQGLLLPRIADTSLINVLNPADGMLVYFTPTKQLLIRANGYWQALSNTALLNNYWSITGNANGALKTFGNTDNYDLPFITNNAERLRITANGFVGIGTTGPATLLHLSGTNPLTMHGVQAGTSTTGDSLLTITAGLVRKVAVSTYQPQLNGTGFVKASGTTITYDNNTYTVANAPITGATKTKITYDSKGLVTAGADATTTDIAEGANLYFTDARVRATPLAGFSTATATAVTATDNVLGGMGKLQAQINSINSAGYLTTNQTITLSGDITGSGNTAITTTYNNVVPANKGGAGTVNGLLKANGSGLVSAAVPGTDYQQPITLTTTGTTGAATLTGTTLNIPRYNPMTTLGDIIYGGAAGAATRLPGNMTTVRQVLISTGTGTAATAPVWGRLQVSDIAGLNNMVSFEWEIPSANKVVPGGTLIGGSFTPGSLDYTITLPATLAGTRASVAVSPNFDLPVGLSIASAYVISTTQIKLRFLNSSTSNQTISPAQTKLYFTVTEF